MSGASELDTGMSPINYIGYLIALGTEPRYTIDAKRAGNPLEGVGRFRGCLATPVVDAGLKSQKGRSCSRAALDTPP